MPDKYWEYLRLNDTDRSKVHFIPTAPNGDKLGGVSVSEKATWDGKYAKPADGIPSTDMASAVQTSLGKADSALQSVPSTYRTAAEQDTIDATKANDDELDVERKRVDNVVGVLKDDSIYTETDDTSTAMSKTVPANAQSYAEVRKIGGKTQVVSGELKSAAVTAVKSYNGSTLLETKSIPAAVQALPGYGCSAGTVYNEIDWVNQKYIQRVAGIDLGTKDWYVNQGVRFMAYFPGDALSAVHGELICVPYVKGETHPDYGGQDKRASLAGETLYIRNTDYTDPAAFKTAMNGVMLYYELATPIETDISSILTADNMITVEAGGSIVFENANSMSMPNTVRYIIPHDILANVVHYTSESKTDEQKAQARTNIGAAAASAIPTKTSDLTNDSGFLTQHQSLAAYRTSSAQDVIDTQLNQAIVNKEATANKVVSLSSASTDTQYPSAKCVYDLVGNVESLLEALL